MKRSTGKCIQVYEGLLEAFKVVNSICAMKLLPYLVFNMNDSNVIYFDNLLIKKFNARFESPFNERTIRNAMSELVKAGIAHRIQNGRYLIDAKYFWAGNSKSRLEFIKNMEEWNMAGLIGADLKIGNIEEIKKEEE